jgi:hypothetical protein
MGDMDHAGIVDAIVKASQTSRTRLNADGTATGDPDPVDVLRFGSELIARAVNTAVAAELQTQSAFMWDVAKMLQGTQDELAANGDEQAAAVVGSQRRAMDELALRLRRRAAAVDGVTEDEMRARAILLAPTEPGSDPSSARNLTPVPVGPPTGFMIATDPPSGEPFPIGHQVCGIFEMVADLEAANAWMHTHMAKCPGPPGPKKDVPADTAG